MKTCNSAFTIFGPALTRAPNDPFAIYDDILRGAESSGSQAGSFSL